MKIALCLIVKSTDAEAGLLAQCLGSIARYVDGIFITITGQNEKVKRVAEMFEAKVSYFEWVNDFSKARNFNFAQVPKDYDFIMWCDADDRIRGAEKLKPTLEEHKNIDAFTMMYLYAFDEWKNPTVVHQKTQIVKNDNSVEWVGALHEDFKALRHVETFHLKGIERLHLTLPERTESAKWRNLDIAKNELVLKPNDPRSYWNLANAEKAVGHNQESIKAFDEFLKRSDSDDEKYITRLRRAECYWVMGEKIQAIDEARYAIGTKPNFPDGYHLLGSLYFDTEQFEQARDAYLMGLTMRPPYYSIIVYNPRDYDYQPLLNLAKTYIRLSLPQMALPCLEACLKIVPQDKYLAGLFKIIKTEAVKIEAVIKLVAKLRKIKDKNKLKKQFNLIPLEMKSHPLVFNLRNINLIKDVSIGNELVIFCGYTD